MYFGGDFQTDVLIYFFMWGEPGQLAGLSHFGQMIFISHSYEILYLTLIKNFVVSLEKDLNM